MGGRWGWDVSVVMWVLGWEGGLVGGGGGVWGKGRFGDGKRVSEGEGQVEVEVDF